MVTGYSLRVENDVPGEDGGRDTCEDVDHGAVQQHFHEPGASVI